MKTEYRLAEALKEMMSITPLDSISVSSLSEKAHIDRKTFYYHFHDIYDLLALIFLNEKIEGIEKCKSFTGVIETIFGYFENNRNFITAAINSAGKDLFQEFIFNNCLQAIQKIIINLKNGKKLPLNDRKALSRYHAFACAYCFVYYLSIHKNPSLKALKDQFIFVTDSSLELSIDELLSKRGIDYD